MLKNRSTLIVRNPNEFDDFYFLNQPFPQYSSFDGDLIQFPQLMVQNFQKEIQEDRTSKINLNQLKKESSLSKQQQINVISQKNICTYIQRTILRCLVSQEYSITIQRICQKHQCSYKQLKKYYAHYLKDIFGISHLILMITPLNDQQRPFKKVFADFLKYFLRNKYSIYMLKYGKMENKSLYFKVKNRLLYLSQMIPKVEASNQHTEQFTSSNFINVDQD